jgi:hypothetical protein
MGVMAGYIDVPNFETRKIQLGEYEFAALSRSTVDGVYEPEPDALMNRRLRRLRYLPRILTDQTMERCPEEHRVEKGNFDRRVYDENRPWCMFNVLMIKQVEEVSFRVAVGRVHVDAVLASGRGEEKIIRLE